MNKILTLFRVSNDLLSRIKGNWIKKLQFLGGITSHYFFKLLKISYTRFPELEIESRDCTFFTRENTIYFWMLWRGYEKETFKQIESEAVRGDVLIDIGANIGIYSVSLAKRGLEAYSFEPIKSNFELLSRNISANRLNDKVRLFNTVLGNEGGTAIISYNPREHGEGSLVLNIPDGTKEKVRVNKLDNLQIKPKGRCFMKIDVEGYEYEVLLGAEKFIKKYKPSIIIEIWNPQTAPYLQGLGYVKEGEVWHPRK